MAIQDFVTAAAVAAGCPTPNSYNVAVKALDEFLATFARSDQRNALNAARAALDSIGIDCSINDALNEEIDERFRILEHPDPRSGRGNDPGTDAR